MIRLFCLAYGAKFVDLFERVTVRSLMQPRNRAVISDAKISLYTDKDSVERATGIASQLAPVEPTLLDAGLHPGEMLHRALIAEIRECLRTGSTLIMAPPDTFWGEGSLANLLAVGSVPNVCVGAAHARVNRDQFLEALPEGVIENDRLVSLSIEHLHRTWGEADCTREKTNTWWSGTSLRKVSDKLWAVQHLLPTIHLARFVQSDLEFFERHDKRGLWDHRWPACLVEQQRQRIIGSSDMFFAAELTGETENIPPLTDRDVNEPDKYRGNERHHAINRNLISVWRER